jgi:hypothetical protein
MYIYAYKGSSSSRGNLTKQQLDSLKVCVFICICVHIYINIYIYIYTYIYIYIYMYIYIYIYNLICMKARVESILLEIRGVKQALRLHSFTGNPTSYTCLCIYIYIYIYTFISIEIHLILL